MRELVRDLVKARISRRSFLSGMAAASYSMTAAKSALAAVEPFIPGGELPEGYVRTATGTAAELMVDQILETGTKFLFCSNGSGIGPICDAIVSRPGLQLIQATHEGQVVSIADGYAMASGRTAFGFYSRVGLPHSSSNMYNAMKSRTPMVLMSDNSDSPREGTDDHEDLDNWEEAVRLYTKWRWEAHEPARLPEFLRRAYKVSSVIPGGPTHIRVPRDLLYKETTATIYSGQALNIPMELRPDASEVERAAKVLLSAESPLMEVGPEISQCNARSAVVELCELLAIPVIQHRSFYCDFPNTHPLWLGSYRNENQVSSFLRAYPHSTDLYICFGGRTRPQGYGGRSNPIREIHASVDPETVGRNAPHVAALVGDLNQIAKALVAAVRSLATPAQLKKLTEERRRISAALTAKGWEARLQAARLSKGAPVPWPRLVYELRQQLDRNAVVVVEQGTEYKSNGLFPFADDAMMKIGRTEGYALGWGVGASAGVKIALPDRQVISVVGDGGFMFGQTDSLWTMSRYDIPVMTVVFNNHSYEETRWNILSKKGPAGLAVRDYVSYLGNPDVDFTRLASAYNIPGAVVKNTDELAGAIKQGLRTLAEGRPFLLDVHTRRIGIGADVTEYQKYSVADERSRKI